MKKMMKEIMMAGLLGGMLALFGCGKVEARNREVADNYSRMRQMLLTLDPETIGLTESNNNLVWAVLMETVHPEGIATLACVGDGTVSLYFSNGGGIIGSGEHEEARKAGLELILAAESALGSAQRTSTFPLPERGHTRFYIMTFDGTYTVDALEGDLERRRHPLSQLFFKGHDVITQIRLIDKNR